MDEGVDEWQVAESGQETNAQMWQGRCWQGLMQGGPTQREGEGKGG